MHSIWSLVGIISYVLFLMIQQNVDLTGVYLVLVVEYISVSLDTLLKRLVYSGVYTT